MRKTSATSGLEIVLAALMSNLNRRSGSIGRAAFEGNVSPLVRILGDMGQSPFQMLFLIDHQKTLYVERRRK